MSETYDPRKTFGAAVTDLARSNSQIVVLSTDSGGSSGFDSFSKEYADRYIELGIQEQGATGVASGLATAGWIPVLCAIAPFVTCRNFEAVRNDLGYMRQNVKIVGRNGGLTYSDLGATHHSLEDYALMRSIPGMLVLAPQDASEIRCAAKAMIEHQGPVYMRIGSLPVPDLFSKHPFEIGRAHHVRQGSDLTIVSTGYITPTVLEALNRLESINISSDVLAHGTVEPLDAEAILRSAKITRVVVTVEEHYDRGGLGAAVSEIVSPYGISVHRIAVPHSFVASGPYSDVLSMLELDVSGIARRIKYIVEAKCR